MCAYKVNEQGRYNCPACKGKFVLAEVSYSPATPEKARIAVEKGAIGILCMNWGSDEVNDKEAICNRGLKGIWGNPTEETFDKIPDIIGVSISRPAGLKLKKLCLENQEVKVKIAAQSTRKWEPVCQPMGIVRGNGKSDQFILISSHLDAWEPGVTCNATGGGLSLELCRILSENSNLLDRDIYILFWNGHEIAEAAGSTWFVDNYWNELKNKCIAYINIDSPGMKDAVLYEVKSSGELYDFAYNNAKEKLDIDIRMRHLTKIGDQSFLGIGIPAVASRMSFTEEYMAKNHGATLGWWNHTEYDGLDKYDMDNMEIDIRTIMSLIVKLCNVTVLPYDFSGIMDTAIDNILKMEESSKGIFPVNDVLEKFMEAKKEIKSLKNKIKDFENVDEEQIKDYNKVLLKISRELTNILYTYADKYQQDSYGYSKLSEAIPLFADMNMLEGLSADSLEFGLLETQLVKNRNRIIDGVENIVESIRMYNKLW